MRRALAVGVAVALLPLGGCGSDDEVLTVLAAASLTEVFTTLATDFEQDHPGVEVELVLGSSTALAEQAVDGAPGDLLATADETSMELAASGGALGADAVAFARNQLTIVTPPGNPAGIEGIEDLDDPAVAHVACVASAPCGVLASGLLDAAGVTTPAVSEEVDVKAVLARVTQGEADAGLVYRTDAVAAGEEVVEVALPADLASSFTTTYLVAPLATDDADRADLAEQFVAHVRSDGARAVLERAGFAGVAP